MRMLDRGCKLHIDNRYIERIGFRTWSWLEGSWPSRAIASGPLRSSSVLISARIRHCDSSEPIAWSI
eukprot:1995394-Amphidinium_carterae.1